MSAYSKNLAQNLIALRKKRSLSQQSLADLAESKRSSITLLESGQGNPTMEALIKIANALQVSIDELISTPKADCQHFLASDIAIDRRSKNGALLRKLLPNNVGSTEMDELTLEPTAVFTGSPHIEGTKEFFTCLEGQITIGVLGTTYNLKKGDVLAFPGDKSHSYKNSGRKKARGVSVVFFTTGL